MAAELFENDLELLFEFCVDECELGFGIFQEVGDCLNLTVRVEWDTYGTAIQNAEIRKCPARMILPDKSDTVAKNHIFLADAICERTHGLQRFPEGVHLRIIADDPHRGPFGTSLK